MTPMKIYFWMLLGTSFAGIASGFYTTFYGYSCTTTETGLPGLAWDLGFAFVTLGAFYGYSYRKPLMHNAVWKVGFVTLTALGAYHLYRDTAVYNDIVSIANRYLQVPATELLLTITSWAVYSFALYLVLFLYAFRSAQLWARREIVRASAGGS